jgi:hypothetical protein
MIFRGYGRWIAEATPNAGGKAVEMFSKKVAETGLISANFTARLILMIQ